MSTTPAPSSIAAQASASTSASASAQASASTSASGQESLSKPSLENVTREVRFAVVMYGGVSLAIYINGVAQELLRMVRSTAFLGQDKEGSRFSTPGKKLTGTERVYRKLSYLLADKRKSLEQASADVESDADIQTRLIVDIISGTSAGGINGVFLGKALANGQDMEQLKQLWITEGDISVLINDKKSIEHPLSLQNPPASLLNSERMYLKLLQAFDGMEKNNGAGQAAGPDEKIKSPCVDELDLFVTATDIEGVTVPLRLADNIVYERRYRNVFHFKFAEGDEHGPGRNDFQAFYNPFLAFASRCTSAFPFAFEPMSLCDIDKVVGGLRSYYGKTDCQSSSERWQPFFKDYLTPTGVPDVVPFPQRAFGDGGYLDNKPFTYATETLSRRSADVPVERRLIYIEPSPEHPEEERQRVGKPDPIENVMAALLTLPRYETIREDLQRVLERNRLIQRVDRILNGIEHDVEKANLEEQERLSDEEWARLDLTDMIKRKGRGYVAYHRLEIAAVTDNLAKLVSRLAGFDEESDYFMAIRSLIRAWRDRSYVEHRSEGEQMPTMNQFLIDYDLTFSLRRIIFLRNKIDRLYLLDQEARELLGLHDAVFWQGEVPTEADAQIFRQQLLSIKRELNKLFKQLRSEARLLQSRSPKNPLIEDIQELGKSWITSERLNIILGKKETEAEMADLSPAMRAERIAQSDPAHLDEDCVKRAKEFLDDNEQVVALLNNISWKLAGHLNGVVTKPADKTCLQMLFAEDSVKTPATAAQRILEHYYRHYDDYDMITFPILYNTDVGEADVIQIMRFSPEDATALIDETGLKCHKLAGAALGHFGAFLARSWRENDILWGRLDGAERIIKTLLPNHPQTRQLIGEAQAAIVCETIRPLGTQERYDLLVESLMRTNSGSPDPKGLSDFIGKLKAEATDPELKAYLDQNIVDKDIRDYYLKVYEERSRLSPKPTLRTAARATTVIGKMLEGLSEKYDKGAKGAAWVTRLGNIFWGLVEVAVPRSIPNLLFHYWLKLLYLFEALLIIVSPFLGGNGAGAVQTFGWKALGITLLINAAVLVLTDLMRGRIKRWRKTKFVIKTAVMAVVILGVVEIVSHLKEDLCLFIGAPACDWLAAQAQHDNRLRLLGAGVIILLLALLQLLWYLKRNAYKFGANLRRGQPE